jgi:uncharacterized membrane protein (Fun14 family)
MIIACLGLPNVQKILLFVGVLLVELVWLRQKGPVHFGRAR